MEVPFAFNEYIEARDLGLLDHIDNGRNWVTDAVLHCNKKMKENLSVLDICNVIMEYFMKASLKDNGLVDAEIVVWLVHLKQVQHEQEFENKAFAEDVKFCTEVIATQNIDNLGYC